MQTIHVLYMFLYKIRFYTYLIHVINFLALKRLFLNVNTGIKLALLTGMLASRIRPIYDTDCCYLFQFLRIYLN